jgi:hypothetical protein
MRTHHDKYQDFLLTDDEYISRISRKLADEARLRSRHRNREPGDDEDFEGYEDDLDDEKELEYVEDEDKFDE